MAASRWGEYSPIIGMFPFRGGWVVLETIRHSFCLSGLDAHINWFSVHVWRWWGGTYGRRIVGMSFNIDVYSFRLVTVSHF